MFDTASLSFVVACTRGANLVVSPWIPPDVRKAADGGPGAVYATARRCYRASVHAINASTAATSRAVPRHATGNARGHRVRTIRAAIRAGHVDTGADDPTGHDVEPVARRWGVPFLACRGFASLTAVAEAVARFDGRRTVVLYVRRAGGGRCRSGRCGRP